MNPDRVTDDVARQRRQAGEALDDAEARRPASAVPAGARVRSAAPSAMGAPKGYFLRSGERVPSVTTIIGRFKGAHGSQDGLSDFDRFRVPANVPFDWPETLERSDAAKGPCRSEG